MKKGTLYFWTAFISGVFLIAINLSMFLSPLLIGYGGQWARHRNGTSLMPNDRNFYPQANLHDFAWIAFVVIVISVLLLILRQERLKRFRNIVSIYGILGILPFIWLLFITVTGFDYSKCNIPPGSSFQCVNPHSAIVLYFAVYSAGYVLTLLWLKTARNYFKSNKKSLH